MPVDVHKVQFINVINQVMRILTIELPLSKTCQEKHYVIVESTKPEANIIKIFIIYRFEEQIYKNK